MNAFAVALAVLFAGSRPGVAEPASSRPDVLSVDVSFELKDPNAIRNDRLHDDGQWLRAFTLKSIDLSPGSKSKALILVSGVRPKALSRWVSRVAPDKTTSDSRFVRTHVLEMNLPSRRPFDDHMEVRFHFNLDAQQHIDPGSVVVEGKSVHCITANGGDGTPGGRNFPEYDYEEMLLQFMRVSSPVPAPRPQN